MPSHKPHLAFEHTFTRAHRRPHPPNDRPTHTREQRLSLGRELWVAGETLPLLERPSAAADVSYLVPHFRQILDEWHEVRAMV